MVSFDNSSCIDRLRRKYIHAGVNRVPHIVDWGPHDLVAFGTHNAVAIYDFHRKEILYTLPGHTDRVNAVRWISKNQDALLLSASADSTLRIWRPVQELSSGSPDNDGDWECCAVLSGHTDSVTAISSVVNQSIVTIVSTGGDEKTLVYDIPEETLQTGGRPGDPLVLEPSARIEHYPHHRRELMNAVSITTIARCDKERLQLIALGGIEGVAYIYGRLASSRLESPVCKLLCSLHGHTDWITDLAFTSPDQTFAEEGTKALLASCSQDRSARIWHINSCKKSETNDSTELGAGLGLNMSLFTADHQVDLGIEDSHDPDDSSRRPDRVEIGLETLLTGHEDWVVSVCWQPTTHADGDQLPEHASVGLLTSSMDRTMMIWKPEPSSGIWLSIVSVGEAFILGEKGNGYTDGRFSSCGRYILAGGQDSALHVWKRESEDLWSPQISISGHSGPVTDCCWDSSEQVLFSCSEDKTTRAHLEWASSVVDDRPRPASSWHEIARPQVHGHPLNSIDVVRNAPSDRPFWQRLCSAGDEKCLRLFDAPRPFAESMKRLCKTPPSFETHWNKMLNGASLTALGLSNKPLATEDLDEEVSLPSPEILEMQVSNENNNFPEARPQTLDEPPLEEHLCQNTLWPEMHKLYGHGNEVYAVAHTNSHRNALLASACKAQSSQAAEIILWDSVQGCEVQRLSGHNLTVTSLAFSPNDEYLVSTSRDRALCLYSRDDKGCYALSSIVKKAHDRILWSCSFSPQPLQLGQGQDDNSRGMYVIATGSRDKSMKTWLVDDRNGAARLSLLDTVKQFSDSITAVSYLPALHDDQLLLAIGSEKGTLEVWSQRICLDSPSTSCSSSRLVVLDDKVGHTAAVKRIRARRLEPSSSLDIATCSEDGSVRIFEMQLAAAAATQVS